MDKQFTVDLDKKRSLVFGSPALVILDEKCGINLMDPATYQDFSPKQIRDMVWAGQLHMDDPLTREQIAVYVPTKPTKYFAMVKTIAAAVRHAIQEEGPKSSAPADSQSS